MALLDFGSGGDFTPSEPAPANLPPLPQPAFQMPNFLGALGGFSDAVFHQAPQELGQGFSQAESATHAAWDDASSFVGQQSSMFGSIVNREGLLGTAIDIGAPQNMGLIAAQTSAGVEPSPNQPPSGDQVLATAGRGLNQGLQAVANASDIPGGGPSQVVHGAAVLAQGVGNLLQDTPNIDQDLTQSFQEGLTTTFSNAPDADQRNHQAAQKLIEAMGQVTNDLFDPQLMHVAVRDSLINNGADETTANKAADYVAPTLAMIASFAAPGGMGKVMLAQFVAQLISDPGAALRSFTDLNPSDPNQQQTTGDFVHLFGKTWAWMNGQDNAPTSDEVSKGFNALAYDVGIAFGGLHGLSEGVGGIQRTRSAFDRGLTGSDPSGAEDLVNGTTNTGQADQSGAASQTNQIDQAPPAGQASSPQTPGGISEGSRAAIEQQLQSARLSTALANQIPQAEVVPEAYTQSLSPDLGNNRLEQSNGLSVSGQGLNDDSARIVDQATQHLQNAGLTDVVNNVHVVHGEEPGVAGGFSTDFPQSVVFDAKNAYRRPDPNEFLADAQAFVSAQKPEDMDPKYADAVTQGLENVHNLIYSSPEQTALATISHEALHAETWARSADHVGNAPIDALPYEWQSIGRMAVGLLNSLKESGVGQRWLAHDSTQASIGSEISQIEKWANSSGSGGWDRLINPTEDGPLVRLIEHFNYQLQWAKGLSQHPYSLQAGDNAYRETFYNLERSNEAAQLAGQWFDATKDEALAAVQSGSILPSTASAGRVYARPSNRSGGPGGSDQRSLAEKTTDFANQRTSKGIQGPATAAEVQRTLGVGFNEATDIANNFNKTGGVANPFEALPDWLQGNMNQLWTRAKNLGIVDDVKRLAAEGKTAGQIARELKLGSSSKGNPFGESDATAMVRTVRAALGIPALDDIKAFQKWQKANTPTVAEITDKTNQVINNTQEQPKPGVIPEQKAQAPNWRQLSYDISNAGPTDKLAALKGIALATKAAYEKVDAGISAGIPADDLHKLATDLTFEIARFRAAHDLYTSSTTSKLMDKDHPDYKATRGIARQIDQSNATPNEKAAMGALKLGMTLEEARKAMTDAHLGLDTRAINWHPEYKNLLLGELGKVAKDAKVQDGKPILGQHNIPMHEWIETDSLKDIQDARKAGVSAFKDERDAIQAEITKAQMRASVKGADSEKQAIKELQKQLRTVIQRQALEAARLEARITNHPDTHQARIANAPPETAEEAKQMLTNPNPAAHVDKLKAQTALTAQKSDQELAKEAAAANGKLAAPVPTIFGVDSMTGENKLTEDGRLVEPELRRAPGEGKIFFGPNYVSRLSDLRQFGGQFFHLANHLHDFMVSMTNHFDPAESLFSPAQQATAFWQRATVEVPWRVHEIELAMNDVLKGFKRPGENMSDVGRRILRPIDNLDEAERRQAMSNLTAKEAAVANMFNEFWRATKIALLDNATGKPVLEHYVDEYVPHIVLEDPDGKPLYNKRGNTVANKWTSFARDRIEKGTKGEPLYKTLDALTAAGFKVETDAAKVWREHTLSVFKALQLRQLMGALGGDKDNIYRSPDGKFVGPAVIHSSKMNDARALKDYTGLEMMRHVKLGPGERVFDMFYVHPEVAEAIERFSKAQMGGDLPHYIATGARGANEIFKIFHFSLNPSHAARVLSNIAIMSSKWGVDMPFNVASMYSRAARAMQPADRTLLRRLNPVTSRNENYAIQQVLKAEKALTDVRARLAKVGVDPDKPLDPDHPKFAQLAPIYDQLNQASAQLRQEGDKWNNVIGVRDQRMLSELMGKGLTLPREVADASGQGWASNVLEHIPGLAQFHTWMWKDVVWNGMVGLAMHQTDNHIKLAARELHGWDGRGGAQAAEALLTPAERDRAMRQAVYDAKMATGVLAKSDMSLAWQTYGRGVLLSAPWTLSQARTVRDAALGNIGIARRLGRPDYALVSNKMIQSGFGQKEANLFDSLHTKMARRMLFSGVLRMAMVMAAAQPIISLMITKQPTNMIQNFQKDPTHTFDIWAGNDPATGQDIWLAPGFFGWQRELAEYVLASVKAMQEGKGPMDVAYAPIPRFANKNNPMLRIPIEWVTNTELGKWMNGWSDPSISGDVDIQALHQAMNAWGVPDAGSTEDKLLYILRTAMPAPSFPGPIPIVRDANNKEVKDDNGLPIPLYTDPRSILGQVLNPAQWEDPLKLSAYIMGTQYSESSSLDKLAQNQATQQANQETQAQFLLRNQSMRDLSIAFQHGDLNKVQQIRDANGLTNQQVAQAIEWTNSYSVSGRTVTTKGIMSGSGPISANKPVTIGSHVLTTDEKATYERDLSNRQIYVEYQLNKNPYFTSASATEKSSMLNSVKALSDKWTSTEWDYKLNGNGSPVTDEQFKELIANSIEARSAVKMALLNSPGFQTAAPMEQQKMLDSYSTFANTLSWDQLYGKDKGIASNELPAVIMTSVNAEQKVKDYLGQTSFFQTASPQEQDRMLGEYGTLTQQSALNMFNGKLKGVEPFNVDMYVRSIINVEESSKYLLHQSDFYQQAPLTTQKSLDSKYQTMSRTIALKDWQAGSALTDLSQSQQAFEIGSERTVLGHLMADQAFTDLQNQYGGPERIKGYADELSSLQKQVRESTTAPPRTINYLVNQVKSRFLAQNPQYAAYLQARTNWERGSQLGQLYSALNADDQSLAAVDTTQLENYTGVADPLSQVADQQAASMVTPTLNVIDTVTDPNSVTPYVDVTSPMDQPAGVG